MTVEASGDQALHPQHQVTGRRDLVWSTFISLEDMVQKSISNQVKPFSFSTSVRPRKKKENLGLEINAAKSYIICLLCKYRDPRLEKVILKKAISSCGDSRCSSVSTVLSSWPCLFPVFVWLLLLLAPHCWERLNSRPALTCLWGFTKHQLTVCLNSCKARLILCSLTAFHCFAKGRCICLKSESFSRIFPAGKMTHF